MKKKKHLEFYKKFVESGKLPEFGLCDCAHFNLIHASKLQLFYPTSEDVKNIIIEGKSAAYWASDIKKFGLSYSEKEVNDLFISFTPLRQTIVLFMAALNNEL